MDRLTVRTVRLAVVVLLATAALAPRSSAQSLTFSVFDRYVETLREQAAIPGLSAAIVQHGKVVWERGFGMANVEASIAAAPDTPYPINDLSQTFGSTLLLHRCLEGYYLTIDDRVIRWLPSYPEPTTTVGQLLRHATPAGTYNYSPNRFATLTDALKECARNDYVPVLVGEILDRLAMTDSVPGEYLEFNQFPAVIHKRYAAVLRRVATPYRVDSRGKAIRSDYSPKAVSASTGIVSTVRDLARYDEALERNILLLPETLELAWTPGEGLPTGLGWFVQRYNGEQIVWHAGYTQGAYSSLFLRVPGRHATMILLANSDGLGSHADGDITKSLFARLFLGLLIP